MTRVHIISGFLGAGKTTLIKKLLKNIDDSKVVIENEFGEVGIDGEIIARENYNVVELAEGCICCTLKTDFEASIKSVMADYKPKHIIIEPTGIGLLSDILKVFIETDLKEKLILTRPITVVDPTEYLLHIDNFGGFFKDQIANAGIIVISKAQLTDKETLDQVITSIRQINRQGEILVKDWKDFTDLDYNDLTNIEYQLDNSKIKFIEVEKNMTKDLKTISIRKPREFSERQLRECLESLSQGKFGQVIRAKGFVSGEDGDLEFSFVNSNFNISENTLKNKNRLCIIGKKLNKEKILKDFQAN